MIFYSAFVRHWTEARRHMPAGEAEAIRVAAVARVTERQRAGRADGPLDFADLCERIELALGGVR